MCSHINRILELLLIYSLIAIVFCAQSFAQGGPPLITDDPGTPGDGHWEINTAITYTRTPDLKEVQIPHVDINYGLGDHIQLKYEGGWLASKSGNENWNNGADDFLAGIKWRFLDEEISGIDMSTYPQIEANNPPGTENRAVGTDSTNVFLPIEIARTLGDFNVSTEFGYQIVEHSDDLWVMGVAAGYRLNRTIELLGELRGTANQELDGGDALFNLGSRITITKEFSLIFSAGRSFRSSPDSATILTYCGFTLNL